jgi:osmotically inducible lipoprotein OsmB
MVCLSKRQCDTGSCGVWRGPRKTADFFHFKDFIMNTHLITSSGTILLVMSLAACSGMTQRDQNTAAGAAIGGVAGSVLSGGSPIGTIGGAAVGGVIGNQVNTPRR